MLKIIFLIQLFLTISKTILCIKAIGKLSSYNVNDKITVSGISSGAAMATQLQVAHSSVFSGVGIVAGPPYLCSGGSSLTATTTCMTYLSGFISLPRIFQTTSDYVAENLIDSTDYLEQARVYLYSGVMDYVVNTGVVKKTQEFFQNFIRSANIKSIYTIASAHGFITNFYGFTCSILASNFFNNCNYNQAHEIISHLYAPDNIKEPVKNSVATGDLIEFDQSEFNSNIESISMDKSAYIYVPKNCANGAKCSLHVALHGCLQGKQMVNNEFATYTGYNQLGDLNNIIIVYPQARSSSSNPNGCWDWWGYTNSLYATKLGPQIKVIKAIVDRIRGV